MTNGNKRSNRKENRLKIYLNLINNITRITRIIVSSILIIEIINNKVIRRYRRVVIIIIIRNINLITIIEIESK